MAKINLLFKTDRGKYFQTRESGLLTKMNLSIVCSSTKKNWKNDNFQQEP